MVSNTFHGRRPTMRRKRDTQGWLDFQPSNLKLTNDHYARYEAISEILDETPRLLELVHCDLAAALEEENREGKKRGGFTATFASTSFSLFHVSGWTALRSLHSVV
jgi:hypothetical protein